MHNDISIGNLLFFMTLQGFFISSANSLSDLLLKMPLNKKNIKILNDVLNLDQEEINVNGIKIKKIDSVSLKNYNYTYDKNILSFKDYKINHNIQIYGQNGSGKSTLMEVLALNQFGKGNIEFNDLEHDFYNLE